MAQEQESINRLLKEIEQDKQVAVQKKHQEREYFSKIMQENTKNKEIAKKQKERERQEDIAAQKAYAKMLDLQEQDRKNELAAREKRAQDFMNRMADGVLKTMDDIMKKEDEMIVRYERQRELRLLREEEEK